VTRYRLCTWRSAKSHTGRPTGWRKKRRLKWYKKNLTAHKISQKLRQVSIQKDLFSSDDSVHGKIFSIMNVRNGHFIFCRNRGTQNPQTSAFHYDTLYLGLRLEPVFFPLVDGYTLFQFFIVVAVIPGIETVPSPALTVSSFQTWQRNEFKCGYL
jgi:hypothetical protein